jgi:hypothetical protein
MNDNHFTPFIGSCIALISSLTTQVDIESWLKLTSLAVGCLAGVLGCTSGIISIIKNLRK